MIPRRPQNSTPANLDRGAKIRHKALLRSAVVDAAMAYFLSDFGNYACAMVAFGEGRDACARLHRATHSTEGGPK